MATIDKDIDGWIGESSASLHARARLVMPRGNSRHSIFFPPHPIYCRSAQGSRIVDVDDDVRIDFVNNFSSLIHGHAHPDVVKALRDQIAQVMAVGLPTEAEVQLAELLCSRIPSVEQLRFTNSGTEAVMLAVKAARAFTGRPAIAKFEGCYHGTYDPVEVSQAPDPSNWGKRERPASVPLSRGTPQGIIDDTLVLPFNDAGATARLLEFHASRLAGIIIDPVPAHLGYLQISPETLEVIDQFAAGNGTLIIADEVYSLRLGYHGAQHRFGIRPDLTVMGKIIGGGLPIGALGGSEEVMSVFDPIPDGPAVAHGGTYNANPLSMAAGLASMRALTKEAIERLEQLGTLLRFELRGLSGRSPVDFIVEGVGSLVSLTFSSEPVRDYRDLRLLLHHRRRVQQFHRAMLGNGILMTPQGFAILSTAMVPADIDAFVAAAEASLREVE